MKQTDKFLAELENFLLFCISEPDTKAMDKLMASLPYDKQPLAKIANAIMDRVLDDKIKEAGLDLKFKALLRQILYLDLESCELEDILTIEGIDLKSAHKFMSFRESKNHLPTQKEKIVKYEQFLHDLQMYAFVVMDSEKVRKLISNACDWSYAHRQGNGELSEREQNKLIKSKFDRLLNTDTIDKKSTT